MRTLIVLGLLAAVWRGLGTEGFSVQGPREPLVARPGDEVLLPCSVDSAVPLQELEVEWLRTDPDTLVLLFSEGESRPESQHQSYRGRAELFPQEIPRGNFSLMLANVTAEDTGVYRCAVHTAQGSGETTVELKEQERLVVTGADRAVVSYPGGEVVLSCSVDTNVPLQELEVQWMRTDSEALVLLFSEGVNRPESQHQSYRGRAELFPQEIPRGNFSLRLKDVRTEDKGEYMCRVHTDSGSANTTAELKELRFSTAHIWILLLALSALGVVILTSVPTYQFLLKKRETSRGWRCCLVNCVAPGLLLSAAFILWGQTEGFLQESVTCATVSVLRILLVSMMAPYSHRYPDTLCKLLKHFCVPFVLGVVLAETCSVALTVFFKTRAPDKGYKTFVWSSCGWSLLAFLTGISIKAWRTFSENPCQRCPGCIARSACCQHLLRSASCFGLMFSVGFIDGFYFGITTQTDAIEHITGLVVSFAALFVLVTLKEQCGLWGARASLCHKLALVALLTVLITFSLLWLSKAPESDRGRLGRMCESAFLWILTILETFENLDIPARAQVGVYVLGSSVLPAVSAIALTAELILKAEKGRRTLTDLRLVVLPCQILLVVCWLVLLMCADYKEEKNRSQTESQEPSGQNTHNTHKQEEQELEEQKPLSSAGAQESAGTAGPDEAFPESCRL
ncbi:uncharacterized protein [Lepisosteus oculatus]|uniref:uncharacterized protein n=1 Tax=Lepisosteus oculatus TaxID=7918 RepID=UPI0035F506CB